MESLEMADDGPERNNTRHAIELPAVFETGERGAVGCVANLSRTGVFIRTSEPPEVGEVVELSFVCPDRQLVRASGAVRWRADEGEKRGFGVELQLVDQDYTELIDEHLDDPGKPR